MQEVYWVATTGKLDDVQSFLIELLFFFPGEPRAQERCPFYCRRNPNLNPKTGRWAITDGSELKGKYKGQGFCF